MSILNPPVNSDKTSHFYPDVIGHSFTFLMDDRMSQIVRCIDALGRYRQVSKSWNSAGIKKQNILMQKIRSFACPSISGNAELFSRCSQFFQNVKRNMQQSHCSTSHTSTQMQSVTLLSWGRWVFNLGSTLLGEPIPPGNPVLIMGDLENQKPCKKIFEKNTFYPWQLAITDTGKLIGHDVDIPDALVIWDTTEEAETVSPCAKIITPLPFSNFCLLDQTIICLGRSSIFSFDLHTGKETGERIEHAFPNMGEIAATQTKICSADTVRRKIHLFDRIRGCYERSITLPKSGRGLYRFFSFNDQLFFAAWETSPNVLGGLHFIDLINFSVHRIANDAVDARAVCVPKENVLELKLPHYLTFRELGSQWLNTVTLTSEDGYTRIYDLHSHVHLVTAKQHFTQVMYNTIYNGKLYVCGAEKYRLPEGGSETRGQVDIFDFNPPQETQISLPFPLPAQRAHCFQSFCACICAFFMSIWNSLCACITP